MTAKVGTLAGILTTVFAAGALTLGIGSPVANAADGCAQGYHFWDGTCVVNVPGPNAVFNLPNPGCWHDGFDLIRCFPGAV
jgi:hypothetical protein